MIGDYGDYTEIIRKHQKNYPVIVVPLADGLGVNVFRVNDWPDDLSGLIKKDSNSDSGYSIYVNAKHSDTRRRFTIAHEIAHYMSHRGYIGDGIVDDALYRSKLSSRLETQANQLAAEILMPWHLLNDYRLKPVGSSSV